MIISTVAEKVSDQIQLASMTKILSKSEETEGKFI